jgi:hypothetical protein
VYCSLDKIDLGAHVDGRPVAVQTDLRTRREIEAEPELSALYAMTRVLNARTHLAHDGHPGAAVHYVVTDEPPPILREALRATGCTLERGELVEPGAAPCHAASAGFEKLGPGCDDDIGALADRSFAALARRVAARMGTRDLAIALRMLEDQTFTDPPGRDDEAAYWSRVLELAALAGELLRAKYPGRWVQTDRALVPFGFTLTTADSTVVFPTNRAQRVIEDGREESLFKLLIAAEETMQRPLDATGRLMPSLRHRRDVELDEIVWRPVLAEHGNGDLPIIVCGVDGESTFGMIRREALERAPDDALDEAIANVAAEAVSDELLRFGELAVLAVTGSFYAAEKLLDRAFMQSLHRRLDSAILVASTPARGLLMVSVAHDEPAQLARFAALSRMRYDDAGGRAISPAVLVISDGHAVGYVRASEPRDPPETGRTRADTSPELPRVPGFFRRLLGRK